MAMKLIKKMAEYKIFMRGDNRYAVQDANGKPVNGEEKVRILVEEDLIKVTLPSPKEEASECDGAANSGDGAKEVAAEADDAAEEIGDALPSAISLRKLHLEHNKFTYKGAEVLLHAAMSSGWLRELFLDGNLLSPNDCRLINDHWANEVGPQHEEHTAALAAHAQVHGHMRTGPAVARPPWSCRSVTS